MEKKEATVFALSPKELGFNNAGTDMIRRTLGLSEKGNTYYGSGFNDTEILAGALTQAQEPVYVAVYVNGVVYAINDKKQIRKFINRLLKEKRGQTASYDVFVENFVPLLDAIPAKES